MHARPILVTLAAVAALVACRGKPHDKPVPHDAPPPVDAAVDWKVCDTALADRGPGWPLALLEKCPTCPFGPILAWDLPSAQGGTTMSALAAAMTACNAFCSGGARDRFLGTVEQARGMTRAPWRYLGEQCKEAVGADAAGLRFASAAYFAFDRLARSVAAHGGASATALAAVDLPLPPITVSGNGPQLPSQAHNLVELAPGQLEVTLLGQGAFVGKLPHAHLDASGIHVVADGEAYPGKPSKDVQHDLGALGAQGDVPVAVVAPTAVPAASLAALVDGTAPPFGAAAGRGQAPTVEAGPAGKWQLAVERDGTLSGWPDIALMPVRLLAPGRGPATVIHLDGPPAATDLKAAKAVVIEAGDHATIDDLAAALAQVQAAGFDQVGLTRRVSH